jgi:hypothetical protein
VKVVVKSVVEEGPSPVAAPAATDDVLNQRREEERRQREDMARTINLDQHREALLNTDDV